MIDKETVQTLTSDCGHHCGKITVGKITHVKHCACTECHGGELLGVIKKAKELIKTESKLICIRTLGCAYPLECSRDVKCYWL